MSKVPKLQLPDQNYHYESSSLDTYLGIGFPGKCHEFLKNEIEKNDSVFTSYNPKYTKEENNYKKVRDVCDYVNRSNSMIRKNLAAYMQDYILAAGGKVEKWPDSYSHITASLQGDDYKLEYTFDYFASDYITYGNELRLKQPGFVFRNYYELPDDMHTTEYKNMISLKELSKEKVYSDRDEKYGTALLWIFVVYCTYGLISLIPGMLIGRYTIGAFLDSIWMSLPEIPGKIVYYLELILFFPFGLFADVSPVGKVLFVLFLIIVVYFLGIRLIYSKEEKENIKYRRQKKKEIKKAKAEWKALKRKKEHKRIIREDEQYRKDLKAFAQEWHKAWYEWICSNKNAPAGLE